MKESTKLKYKNHTQLRFVERIASISDIKELDDDDYHKLCDRCKTDEVFLKEKLTKTTTRKFLKFDGLDIACIVHRTGYIKTIYPVSPKRLVKIKIKNNIC